MPEDKLFLSWDDHDVLCQRLVDQLADQEIGVILAIVRGGLVPAGILSKRMGITNVHITQATNYDEHDVRLPSPIVSWFPPAEVIRGQRVAIVDDCWHTGTTYREIKQRVIDAGGFPIVATLFYKPGKSLVSGQPDFYVEKTDKWIVFPTENPTSVSPRA